MAIDKTITKILNKLFEKGYVSEKAIMSLSLEDICKIEALIRLKEAVKSNKVISYLSGGDKDEAT